MNVCLVGATHPCHNPRLVREADTLVEAGHDVRVVSPCYTGRLTAKDARLLRTRRWRFEPVDFRPTGFGGKLRSVFIRGRRRAAGMWQRARPSLWSAEHAYSVALPELRRRAASERADWFIAHAQAALPVAAWAAQQWNARLGFDCEDLLSISGSDPTEIVNTIEEAYLRRCDYVSVPTVGMARYLQARRGIAPPIVFHNVFPLQLAAGMTPPLRRPLRPTVRLHWFSQVIGPGRGLEDAIRALEYLGRSVELHLRGSLHDVYRTRLTELAVACGVNGRVFFYSQVDHDDLIRSMADFDIGLALERPDNSNYSLTVTNKIFSYLLAGLPVAATNTPGQLEILRRIPSVSTCYSAGDFRALARGLEPWVRDAGALRAAQEAAWCAAREEFCWDRESPKFLAVLAEPIKMAAHDRHLASCAAS